MHIAVNFCPNNETLHFLVIYTTPSYHSQWLKCPWEIYILPALQHAQITHMANFKEQNFLKEGSMYRWDNESEFTSLRRELGDTHGLRCGKVTGVRK